MEQVVVEGAHEIFGRYMEAYDVFAGIFLIRMGWVDEISMYCNQINK
ncbi:hypothetical protein DSUL_90060 [Desulfovibrionales bacterium]